MTVCRTQTRTLVSIVVSCDMSPPYLVQCDRPLQKSCIQHVVVVDRTRKVHLRQHVEQLAVPDRVERLKNLER